MLGFDRRRCKIVEQLSRFRSVDFALTPDSNSFRLLMLRLNYGSSLFNIMVLALLKEKSIMVLILITDPVQLW